MITVITDSRGDSNLFQTLWKENPNILEAKLLAFPGAKLESLTQIVKQLQLSDKSIQLFIVAGGICDLTSKTTRNNQRLLTYDLDEGTRQRKRDQIRQKHVELQETKSVLVCTIPPACIVKYFMFNNPGQEVPEELFEQQNALIQDLLVINTQIFAENDIVGLPTIDLARYLFNISIKKRRNGTIKSRVQRFSNINLYDGVHFNEKLKKNYHMKIVSKVQEYIQLVPIVPIASSSASGSSDKPYSNLAELENLDTESEPQSESDSDIDSESNSKSVEVFITLDEIDPSTSQESHTAQLQNISQESQDTTDSDQDWNFKRTRRY